MIKFVYSQTTNALEVYTSSNLFETDDVIFVQDNPRIITHNTTYWGDVSRGAIPALVLSEFTEENITADNISLRPSSPYSPDGSFSNISNTMSLGAVTQQLDYRTLRDASNIADLSSNALIKNSTSNYELTKFKNNLVYLSGVSDSSDDGHILFMGHDADGSTSVFDIDLNHVHTVKIGNRYISTDADNTITDYQINVLGWAADASKLGTYDASSYGRTIQIDGFDPIPAVQGTFRISAETLRGYQGQQGIQGQQGTQGLQGLQGLQGKGGIQGEQGAQGLQGLQGLQGKIGSQGEQGLQGLQGLQGRWGEQGIQGQAIYETSKSLHLQGTDGKYIDFNGSKDVSVSGIYNAKNASNADVADHATQAAKLTTDAGDVSVPIYFKNGVPVAMDGSIGGSQQPVYLNNGKITPGDALGTMAYENASSYRKTADDKTLYVQGVDGTFKTFNGSADVSILGVKKADSANSATQASYASKLNTNAGDSSTPVYFNNGVPVALSGNIGDASLPVYIKNGHITAGNRLKTMAYEDASDYVKKSDSTATTKKLYVQGVDGTFKTFNGSADVSILGVKSADTANSATQAAYATRLNSSAGDASHPIYFKDGQPVAMDASIGGAQQPIYLNNGQITAGSALGNMAYEAKSNYPTSLQMAETLQKTQRLTNLEKGDNNGEVKFTQIDSDGSTNTITMNFSHEHFVQIGNSLIATDSSNDVSLFNINISGHANDSSMLGGTPASNYAMALTVEGYETVYAQRGIISVKADLLRGLQGSQGIQGHRGYQGLQGSAVYQTGQALSIQGLNGHYDVFNGSTAKSIQGVYKSQYSEYSVIADRLSTQAVGDNSTFVYFDVNGIAKASNQSVGASDTPVYLNAGHIQAGAKLGSMAYENASEYEKFASKKTLYVQGVNGVFTSFNGSADVSILGVKSADTANSATQAGKLTTDAGDASRFIYFNNGIPVASDLSLGSETKPIFIGNGRFMEGNALGTMAYETASEYVKGSAVKKLYVQGVNGQFTSYDGTSDVSILGVKNADKANSATNATHAADASKLTTGNTGDGSTLVYFSGGVPTKSTSTVGNATNPVYLNNGVLTPCSEDLVTFADTGANDKFIYFNDGVPVASDLSLGSKTSFLYLENGQFKTQALPTPSAGSNTEFIYFNNGVPTKSDVSLGGLQKPIYLDDGMFKEGTALGDMAYESKSNYINSTQAVDLANKVNRITTVARDPSSFGIIKFTQVDSSGNENTISADFNHNHFLNIGNTILTTDQLSSVDTLDISITGTARDTSLFRGLTPSQFVRNVYFNGSNLTPNNGSVSINLGQFSIQDASGIWQGYNGNAPVAIQGVYRASNAEALGGYPSDHYATHSEIAGMDASIKSINYLKNILDHPSNANTITFVGHDMNTGEDSSIDIDFTHSHYFHIGTTAITSDQASNTISSLDIDITGTSRDSSKLGGLDPSNYVTSVNVIGGASYRPNRGVITLYPTDFETANTVKTISVGANTYYVNNQDVSIPSMVNGATANHDGILHLTTLGGGNLDINFNHSHNLYIGDRIFTTNDQDSQNVWKDVGYLSLRAVSGASSAALTLSGMSTWLFHDTTLDYGIYYDRLLHRVEFHGPNNRMSYIDMTNGTFNGWNSMNTGSGGTSTDASYLEGYSLSQIFEEFGQDPTDAKKTYLKIGKTVKTLQIPYAINAGAAESAETATSATSADVATRAQYIGNNDSVRYDASTLLGDVSYNGTNNTLSIKVGNTTKTATISTSPSADYPTGFAARNSQVNNSSLGTWVTGWKDGNPYINFFKSGNALNVQASGAFYNGSYRTVDTNTIGSLTAGYAKLSTDGGAANQPIYIKNGVPATLGSKGDASKGVYIDSNGIIKEMTYRLGKSVPSDAVFTDENATYSGHYTPASNSTSVVTGKTANTSNPTSSITLLHSVFKDGKGHLLDASYYQFTFGSLAYEDSVDKLGGYDTSVFGRKIKIGDVSFTAVNGMFEIPLSVISAQNGSQGAQGKVGPQGSVGAQGSTGSQGKVGSQGAQGLLGVQGSRGSQGPAGSDGNPGSQGAQGRLGNQGSQGARGGSGVGYGEDGAQGAQGAAGSNGTNGTNGTQGAQGARGSAGYGYDGDQGAQGRQGKVGATGIGSQGAQGKVGSQGSVGAQGPAGSSSGTADYLNGDSSSTDSDYYVAFFDGTRRKYNSYFTYNPYTSRLSVYSLDVALGSCEIDDHGWVTCEGVTSNGSISAGYEIKADTHLKAEKSGSSYLFYTASDGAYFASDRRLKENILPISDDLVSKVFRKDTDLLHTFTWKETKHEAAGFIAQELLEVLPNAVDYDKETDKYSVNYNVALSEVLGAAVKKIKTQQEEIHDLRKEIDDLRKLIMEKLS